MFLAPTVGRLRRLAPVILIATALATLVVPASPAVAAPAPPKPTTKAVFGVGPASAKGLDGRATFNYIAGTGARLSDHVEVHNYGVVPTDLTLYAVDATSGANGGIDYRPRANPGSDAETWVTFVNGARVVSVHLAPHQHVILPVQIRIPASASPGDHFAGIAVGLLTKITGNGNTKQNLNLEQRVIARMQFRIGGDVHAVLSVTGLKARYHNNWNPIGQGSATVTYDIRNTGNVVLSGSQRLTVSGLMGASGSVPPLAAIPLLLPGGTAHVTVTIRHVTPALLLHAKVRVTPIPALGAYDPGIHGGSASVGFWAIPWLLLVAIGAILGGTIWGIIRSRGPRRRYSGERRFSDEPALAGKA